MTEEKLNPNAHLIKIHGLQRSGTNYLSHLITTNFKNIKMLVNIGGWKHGHYCVPFTLGQEVNVLVVTKNPYAWLRSVYEYWSPPKKLNIGPDLTNVSFADFVKRTAYFERQKGVPYLMRAANPVQYWNNMNFHYISIQMMKKPKCVVPYESVLFSPDQILLQLYDGFGLEPNSEKLKFVNCDQTFTPSGEDQKLSGSKFEKKKYYQSKKYMKYYSKDLLEYVNANLDQNVMRSLGYQLEVK